MTPTGPSGGETVTSLGVTSSSRDVERRPLERGEGLLAGVPGDAALLAAASAVFLLFIRTGELGRNALVTLSN